MRRFFTSIGLAAKLIQTPAVVPSSVLANRELPVIYINFKYNQVLFSFSQCHRPPCKKTKDVVRQWVLIKWL